MLTIEDKFRGCLVGGATGDALGAQGEFYSTTSISERYGQDGIRDLERSYGVMGAITDDTQMTLFTAEGCIRYGKFLNDVDIARLVRSIRSSSSILTSSAERSTLGLAILKRLADFTKEEAMVKFPGGKHYVSAG